MKIEIKNMYSNVVIFSHECKDNTIKTTVLQAKEQGANLISADLRCANLSGANLSRANLSGANLNGAKLNGANLSDTNLNGANLNDAHFSGAKIFNEILAINPTSITGLYWDVLITGENLKIGCQRHSYDEWKAFSDEQIAQMDSYALVFWTEYKGILMNLCDIQKRKSDKVRSKNGN